MVDEDDSLFPYQCNLAKESVKDVKVSEDLTCEQKIMLNGLLKSNSHIFTDLPGETNLISHSITLTTDIPVRSKPYKVPYAKIDILKTEVAKMLKLGIIKESKSPFASPVVLVDKPDGSVRFCVDYRKMNKITIFDAEPVPNPDAIFAKICNSKYFSKIDLSKGYWQIPISNADGEKTAFVCEHGLFEFVRMPFGLVNSGATFCRLMRKIFKNMDNVVNYIDDLLIYTDTWEDHIRVLSEVFHKLSEANLTARPSKCSFASDNVSFLGHDIGENKIYPQDNKIKKIKDFVIPAILFTTNL